MHGKSPATTETEVFKPVPGYDNYEFSNKGRLRSTKRGNARILKSFLYRGTDYYALHQGDGSRSSISVKTLFELTFGTFDPDRLIPLARAVVRRVSPLPRLREDCFQAAYAAGLMAMRSAKKHGELTNFRYLFLCMQTEVYRLLQAEKKHLAIEIDEELTGGGSPENAVDAAEFINERIDQLSAKQREAIELVFFEGMSGVEAGEVLGIGRKAVSHRVRSALKILRGNDD